MVSAKLAEAHNSQKDKILVEILSQAFGEYQTNCYICKFPQGEIIIDAGMGATQWVIQNAPHPLAILNTHGHFDHIWSNAALKEYFPHTPLVCPKLDCFMLESDCFGTGVLPSKADIMVECDKTIQDMDFEGVKVRFYHFPGHTPGCSMVEIQDNFFSGDFIFHRSIGRSDFPYSSTQDMLDSLIRFQAIPNNPNKIIYPGHGIPTNLHDEQTNVQFWIKHLSA
ncbi:MBL fold metallo-hydrolase [Helicobacter sp. MIT 05-5293]|uniref:MBL fold hydrolase n=1 Tax=uncultured Helicobacter sp. TaxID=175537 RepID=A0A650EK05_9HELI|nr:MBL fold metallo-hydrolase [Helicobacter sp. MIT 05-5293]QGT50077.1 MBL fold hydrolase [uncultured Helicobacter sp.]